jgi:hypothetical protein
MEPIFERDFAPQSYGFRPGKGCKDALRRVDELLKSGYHWVVDADLKGYFDSITHRAKTGCVNVLSGAPYGYRYVRKTDAAEAYYAVIESEAEVVREVFELLWPRSD